MGRHWPERVLEPELPAWAVQQKDRRWPALEQVLPERPAWEALQKDRRWPAQAEQLEQPEPGRLVPPELSEPALLEQPQSRASRVQQRDLRSPAQEQALPEPVLRGPVLPVQAPPEQVWAVQQTGPRWPAGKQVPEREKVPGPEQPLVRQALEPEQQQA
ncbi:MAG: hypothetical protein L0211_14385 [Planctomycetaceae bacterium]|nr:hypothetical protein [Planctomycetaceae bacterium]